MKGRLAEKKMRGFGETGVKVDVGGTGWEVDGVNYDAVDEGETGWEVL